MLTLFTGRPLNMPRVNVVGVALHGDLGIGSYVIHIIYICEKPVELFVGQLAWRAASEIDG